MKLVSMGEGTWRCCLTVMVVAVTPSSISSATEPGRHDEEASQVDVRYCNRF